MLLEDEQCDSEIALDIDETSLYCLGGYALQAFTQQSKVTKHTRESVNNIIYVVLTSLNLIYTPLTKRVV